MNKMCPSCFINKPVDTGFYWVAKRNQPSHECRECHRLRYRLAKQNVKPKLAESKHSEHEPCRGCYRRAECSQTALECKAFHIWVELGVIVPAFVGMVEKRVVAPALSGVEV